MDNDNLDIAMRTYRLKDKYNFSEITDRLGIVSSEKDSSLIKSEVAFKIIKAISSQAITKEELLNDYFSASFFNEAVFTLYQLEQEGVITRDPPLFTPEQSAFWSELGYNELQLSQVLKKKKIDIKTVGSASDLVFKEICRDTGLQFSQTPSLFVVLTDSFIRKELHAYNQEFLERKTPWLLIKTTGSTPLIGPLIDPQKEKSACWKCLEHRLKIHNHDNKLYQAIKKTDENLKKPVICHPLSEGLVAHMTVMEIVSWLYHEITPLENKLFSLDLKTGHKTEHHVVKRPQCSACSDGHLLLKAPKPIILTKQERDIHVAGGYRSISAEETLKKYQHHVSNITGIVPYLKPFRKIEGAPVYNYSSGKNMALQSTSMFWLNHHLRSANGGKGKTVLQSKVGALCESIERYSLMYNGKTHTISGCLNELENAIHPNKCMLYSNKQYRERELTNRLNTKFYALIPNVFNENMVMDWTPVYSLTHKQFKLLPSEYCYAQYPIGTRKETYSYPDSNGCAAGNTIEEAILQGFLELIERDAAAIWWYNRLQRPRVDLTSARNPYINKVVDFYKKANRSLYVLDITTDMNIPVFVAISHNLSPEDNDEIIYAFGAHVDAHLALERSIVELNQLFPVIATKNRSLLKDPVFTQWLENEKVEEHKHFVPPPDEIKNIQTEYPQLCEASIYESIQYCINSAKENNLETLVLDLTQPDIGLPVVKVIVPGLRHFWRRTAPGRLYDVPVEMGWLQKANTEETLNPKSIFV